MSADQTINIWKMNKTQLMAEALQLNMAVHPSWSVGELRQLVSDRKRSTTETSQVPKGLASMTFDQLKAQAQEFKIQIPAKPQGAASVVCSDRRYKGDAVVTFGRHKNKLFKGVPHQYLEWAMREVEEQGSDSSGPDKLMPEEAGDVRPTADSPCAIARGAARLGVPFLVGADGCQPECQLGGRLSRDRGKGQGKPDFSDHPQKRSTEEPRTRRKRPWTRMCRPRLVRRSSL